ncbi:MAG: HAMP domain-containing sensor histidine kinase, partial [Gammaproteobacteria bacterium]
HVARRKLQSAGHDPKSVEEALEQAQVEARRARETLERVRDYVSSGRLDLTEVDVEALVHRLANLMASDAKARGVSITVAGGHHLPAIRADRIQLEQLVLNLLSNAVDAAAEHAHSGGQVQVRIAQRRDQIEIVVEDNGLGIEPSISDRMFEPFETSKRKGMGLGLTLVRQITDAHGGKVGWLSVEPRGTRFIVELPVDGPDRHG